jgi:hypothetical protein
MKILNDHDWEAYAATFQNADPFPSICIDNFLEPEFADLVAAAYPAYTSASTLGREFSTVNEKRKIQVTNSADFPDFVRQLSTELASQNFRDHMTNLSGVGELNWDSMFAGGGMHLTATSGILDVHVDFNYLEEMSAYRRLNILIYLNPVWDVSWGGKVELWDRNVKNCIKSFEPFHNRCIIFATSDYSFHGVTAVNCPEGMSRNSFAAYYYSDDPGDNDGRLYKGNHSTIFKARPEESIKRYVSMPVEKFTRAVAGIKSSSKTAIKKFLGYSKTQ